MALLRVCKTAMHLCSGLDVESVAVKMFEELSSTVTRDRFVEVVLVEFETTVSPI